VGRFPKLGKGFGECLGAEGRAQWLLRHFARNCGQKRGKSEGGSIPNNEKQGPGLKENDKGKMQKYKGSGIPKAKPI
jgi:hypothetical protein